MSDIRTDLIDCSHCRGYGRHVERRREVDRLRAIRDELLVALETMRIDIESHIGIASELATDNERLRAIRDELLAACKEAERFIDYFANGRTEFVGPGTPLNALAHVRHAIERAKEQQP